MKEIEVWIARDENGDLYAFYGKPEKVDDEWVKYSCGGFAMDETLFPSIKWEDKEPTKAKITLIK